MSRGPLPGARRVGRFPCPRPPPRPFRDLVGGVCEHNPQGFLGILTSNPGQQPLQASRNLHHQLPSLQILRFAGGAGEWRWGAERRAACRLGARKDVRGRGRHVVDGSSVPTVTHLSRSLWATERLSRDSETALCGAPHWSDRIPQPGSVPQATRKGPTLVLCFVFH
ncbi:PREDICTED: LOW QUALITY PROTEIN: uncharacterized protein LOC109376373 [Hipposideros armiger]|uniref:LOW QUALITY PROTEIN: uncharacterized protein LOC109376373 n=1 Tax=Hipposideros armiger TaxID=186990 RepID=A0A8B7QGA5_HIPAR|nr:PREDICTED: LOW QUALITY PROTEIN: uncharacterized protein LOC109376373 [Hipposideros armiger]